MIKDAESFVYETLINDAGVRTYTDSVTPMIIPQEVTGNAITFFRISTEVFNVLCEGEAGGEYANMQIDFWGKQYLETINMFNAGRKALEATGKAMFMNRHDERDAASANYRVAAEFKVYS